MADTANATPPQAESPSILKNHGANPTVKIFTFPPNLGTTGDEPYMMIKIYETENMIDTPGFKSTDPRDVSFQGGMEAAVGGVINNPAGAAGAAAISGMGMFQSLLAGASATDFGEKFVNRILDSAIGTHSGVSDDKTKMKNYIGDAKQALQSFSLKRNTEALTAAIGLFMPEQMTATYNQDYEQISVTQALGMFGFVSQAVGSKSIAGATNPYLIEGVSKYLGALTKMNEQGQKLLSYASTGMTLNPQLELLYNSPVLREFQLEYKFYPKSPEEAAILFGDPSQAINESEESIWRKLGIIGILKYYSSPKIPSADNTPGKSEPAFGGRYFIPPAQFQLEFYKKNEKDNNYSKNDYLYKTKNCVLSSLAVDFAPNEGFITHADGVPVEVRLTLGFKETSMLSRADIQGGY